MVETKKQQTRPAKREDGNARKTKGKNIRVKKQARNNPPTPSTGSLAQLESNHAEEKKAPPKTQEEASKKRDQAQESSTVHVQNPKDYFAQIKDLRDILDDYLLLSPDPILEVLIEKKGDLLTAVKSWIPLYELTQAIYAVEIEKGATIEEATKKAEDKKVEIASRILGRGAA